MSDLVTNYCAECKERQDRIEKLEAEVERYKEALERIRDMPMPSFNRSFSREAQMEKIARQALQDTDNG